MANKPRLVAQQKKARMEPQVWRELCGGRMSARPHDAQICVPRVCSWAGRVQCAVPSGDSPAGRAEQVPGVFEALTSVSAEGLLPCPKGVRLWQPKRTF